MEDKIIDRQIKTMEDITSFIDHFRSLPVGEKNLALNDNWSNFQYLKNELEKLPNTPPPFKHPVNPQYLQEQYQSWLKWARRNFTGMGKMLIINNCLDILKADQVDRKLAKLKELINKN